MQEWDRKIMIKTSACVVLYNPSNDILENVATYADKVDEFIIVDNSDIQQKETIDKLKLLYPKLIYINNNANLGIATALNIACDIAIKHECDWILTMDQDSQFVNFPDYLHCLQLQANNINIALLAPNTGRFNDNDIRNYTANCESEEKLSVITSGNFLNLHLFNSIGRFDDTLFIDVVDYDYCIKIQLAEYKILFFKNILLKHQLGDMYKRKNLITRKIKFKREHNPQRVYYFARNYLYLARKYGKKIPNEISLLKVFNIVFIHEITKILLYEEQKFNKIYAKFVGLFHFLIGKYGKYTL